MSGQTYIYDHRVKHFLPCSVNNDFNLLTVWTHRNNSPNFAYIGQFWKYLQVNQSNLDRTIIAGDFNSNAIWDLWDRWWNHSDVLKILEKHGIESLYHLKTNEEQGKEGIPTYFHQKNKEKPFHIDFVFSSQEFTKSLTKIDIGNFEQWINISDHVPIICEFVRKKLNSETQTKAIKNGGFGNIIEGLSPVQSSKLVAD